MERFKSLTLSHHVPRLLLQASLESTALVRTVLPYRSLQSLLAFHLPFILSAPAALLPPPWLASLASLDDALRDHAATPNHLVQAYAQAIEDATAVADHDTLASPVLHLLAAWVAEDDVLRSLNNAQEAANAVPAPLSAAALAMGEERPKPHVLLVRRASSRQDAAAAESAVAAVSAVYDEEHVHVLTLDAEEDDLESPKSVAARIANLVRAHLNSEIESASRSADRARKAARSSFRSWFGGTATAASSPVRDTSAMVAVGEDGARRLSVGSSRVDTPQFAPGSVEALTRRAADLCMLAGQYADATELYRLLSGDCRSLVGAALVHEASAWEMVALATAMVDGSKQVVGSALERAIQGYCKAGRRELAVRATLRGVQFCNEVGFPDSAAGVIIRAVEAIVPSRLLPIGAPAAGGAFVDGAVAVLYTACAGAYAKLGKERRASLYAFLSGSKFAKLKLYAAAASVVRDVDEMAMLRTGVRDEVELILGNAEMFDGRHARAIRHFVSVMSAADEHKDVEVQGSAIRGFLDAAAKGAREAMARRWDTGALFPLVNKTMTNVSTHDSSVGEDRAWKTLEDDVLEDHEFFTALANKNEDAQSPKRERRVETVIAELRKKKEQGDNNDPGGSLEMKVRRMREVAEARRKRRRANSLLDRGAVVGENISIHVSLSNPLHFPVFVDSLSAVVSMDGQVYSSKKEGGRNENGPSEDPIVFVPTDDVTLNPCSSQRITVDLISRKPGELQFLGLSWNFTVGMGGASPKANTSTVPGFCLLERCGRRLNTTRAQRASEVPLYEKDESLVVKVAPPAPKLKASVLTGADGTVDSRLESLTLRAGETRHATLLLRNEGKVPLKDIVIRIGTPQTLFVSMIPDKVDGDCADAVFAIGMHEEIVHQDELVAAARISLSLLPNESTHVPVWLRAAVPRSAFAYRTGLGRTKKGGRGSKRSSEADEEADGMLLCHVRMAIAYGAGKIRVSRVKSQFKIQPSVLVSPRFLREADQEVVSGGDANSQGVLLGLEVEHGGHSLTENLIFQVTELSVTSRRGWKPMLLQEPSDFRDEIPEEISQSATNLRINETATVFFFVIREKDYDVPNEGDSASTEELWQTFSVNLSQRGPGRERFVTDKSQDCQRRTALKDRHRLLEQRASTHFVLCANHGTHSSAANARQGNRDLFYVTVGWKSSSKVHGEIHIPPIDPLRWMIKCAISRSVSDETGKARSVGDEAAIGMEPVNSEPLDQLDCIDTYDSLRNPGSKWLDVAIDHPSTLEHDFFNSAEKPAYVLEGSAATPLPAVVPVNVYIRNVSPYLVDVVFAAPSEGGIADGDRGRYWAGDVAMSLRALPPGAERILSLTAILIGPGRYNMSKFAVLFQTCGYMPSRVRQQVTLEPSYLVLIAKGYTKFIDGELDSSPIMTPNATEPGDGMELPVKPAEKEGSDEILVDDAIKKVHANGTGTAVAQHDDTDHQDKRMKADSPTSTADIKDKLAMRRTRVSPRKGTTGFSSPRSKSQPASERRKPFPRARSDGAAVKIFRGSADDALWNASDTDESEE